MQRRTFLGTTDALGLLPASATATEDAPVTEVSEVPGTGSTTIPQRSPIWSAVEIGEMVTDESTLSVRGHWHDDEPPEIELTIGAERLNVVLNMSTDRARQFAEDIQTAVERAEEGDRELGGGA